MCLRSKFKAEYGTGEVILSAISMLATVGPGISINSWFWSKQVSTYDTLVILYSDHWRKNIPVLAKSHRVYSIDLIGYGYSDKPNPRQFGESSFYTFETWGTQLNDFCIDVVKDEAFFICNSIGGLVGLQAAVMEPQLCKGIMLLNISLRMLHIKKQPWYGRPLIRSFQNLLRNTDVGKYFFKTVATPESVRNILCQCYHDTSQVTEELVQKILLPGLEPGAVDVFLEFICYSGGPLPEELLPQLKCPVLIGWGEKDPWEPIELGRAYGKFDSVEDFVVLPNVGHCPQDEAPDLVNPLVESFVARHAALSARFPRLPDLWHVSLLQFLCAAKAIASQNLILMPQKQRLSNSIADAFEFY
ncbi:pheophytinase chloroplastic isoform X2 [Prunus yedoensis var. nudiflora]|uniref:Pheophytinase chloroplastic isoform X2 n=1 Tax=Prunus yedoensis var. nudiflora TaxID=2094558 RepID=A0A314Z3Q7_PRUYE|nr:pheophytinase chloroplastic isoform X2 [Prunus yedoensis var. nudiflora]